MNICIKLCTSMLIMSTFFGNHYLDELKQVEKETVKSLESTYKIRVSGSGGGAMYGINSVMLAFDINRPITIEEARAILVGSAELYLSNINKNKIIRPYLDEYPFSPSRLELVFYVQSEEKQQDQKHLALFSLSYGGNIKVPSIEYNVRNDNGRLVEIFSETFNKAKERLNGNAQ